MAGVEACPPVCQRSPGYCRWRTIDKTDAGMATGTPKSKHPHGGCGSGNSFSGDIHVHLHGIQNSNPRELARLVGEAVRAEIEKQQRAARGSFRDND
jgi:hypothetical protein